MEKSNFEIAVELATCAINQGYRFTLDKEGAEALGAFMLEIKKALDEIREK